MKLILLLLVFFTHIPAYGMLEESNEDPKKIALDANIKNIQNICANKDTLLLLYQDEEQSSKIKKINFNQDNQGEDITFKTPTNITEYRFIPDKNYIVQANYEHLFFNKDRPPKSTFSAIAINDTFYAYAVFLEKNNKSSSILYIYDNTDNQPIRIFGNPHNSKIRVIYLEERENETRCSTNSTAGQVRHFSANSSSSNKEKSSDIWGHMDRFFNTSKIKILYRDNNFIALEEPADSKIIDCFITYTDPNTETEEKEPRVIAPKKIGSYYTNNPEKGSPFEKESPFLVSNNGKKEIAVYNQYNRSLDIYNTKKLEKKEYIKKLATALTPTGRPYYYKNNTKFNIKNRYSNDTFEEQYRYKVAKQIYYVGNNLFLVYDDQVYKINMEENKDNQPLKGSTVYSFKKEEGMHTIITSTLSTDKNTLWLAIKHKSNENESFYLKSISLHETEV